MIWEVGGQAVLGRQNILPTPWLTERHGYDPTCPIPIFKSSTNGLHARKYFKLFSGYVIY